MNACCLVKAVHFAVFEKKLLFFGGATLLAQVENKNEDRLAGAAPSHPPHPPPKKKEISVQSRESRRSVNGCVNTAACVFYSHCSSPSILRLQAIDHGRSHIM